MEAKDEKCICQICTCGRHRCPRHPGLSRFSNTASLSESWPGIRARQQGSKVLPLNGTFRGLTTNHEDYQEHGPFPRGVGSRARSNLRLEGEFQGRSRAREDFLGGKGGKRSLYRLTDHLQPGEGVIDHQTTVQGDYREHPTYGRQLASRPRDGMGAGEGEMAKTTSVMDDYRKFDVNRHVAKKRQESLQTGGGAFEGETTLAADYKEHENYVRPNGNRLKSSLKLEGDMGGVSHQKEDYKELKGERIVPKKLQDNLKAGSGDFNYETTLGNDYKEHENYVRPTGHRLKSSLGMPEGDITGISNMKDDYKEFKPERPVVKKHPESLGLAEGKFQDETTLASDYKGHEKYVRPTGSRVKSSLRLEGDLAGTSQSKEDFQEQRAERPVVKKLQANLGPADGNFQSETTVSNDYKEHDKYVRPTGQRVKSSLRLPEGDHTGISNMKDDYKEFKPERPVVKKHQESLGPAEGTFQTETTLSNDYKEHENYIRPTGHRLKSSLRQEGELGGISNMKDDYKEFKAEKRVPHKQQDTLGAGEGDFQHQTTSQDNYTEHAHYARQSLQRPKDSLGGAEGEMASSTNNTDDFKEFAVDRQRGKKLSESLTVGGGAFQGATTLSSDYKEHEKYVRPIGQRVKSSLRMEGDLAGTSQAQDDYKEFKPERPVVKKQPESLGPAEGNFQGQTTLSSDYKAHENYTRPNGHRLKSSLRQEGELAGISNMKDDYQEFKPERPVVKKHKESLGPAEGTFQGETTVSNDFKEHDKYVRPTGQRVKSSLRLPEGDSTGISNMKDDFKEFKPERLVVKKHQESLGPAEGTFQSETTVSNDFKEHDKYVRTTGQRVKSSLRLPEGDHTGISNMKDDYKEFKPERPVVKRHQESLGPAEGTFQSETTLSNDFKGHENYVRPTGHRLKSSLRQEGEMAGTSHGQDVYKEFKPERSVVTKHKDTLGPSEGQFQRETTLSNDYKEHENYVRPTGHRLKSSLRQEGELAGISNMKDDYKEFKPERPVVKKHQESLGPAEGTFQTETTVSNDFKEHDKYVRPTGQRVKSSLRLPEGDSTGTSNMKDDYKEFKPERPVVTKHKDTLGPSEGQFQRETTLSNDFKEHENYVRPAGNRLKSSLRQEGDLAGISNMKDDYKEFKPERPVVKKHLESLGLAEGNFQSETTALNDYKEHENYARPTGHRLKSSLRQEGEMSGISHVKDDFKEFKPERQLPFKQQDSLKAATGGEFQHQTTLNDDFKEPAPSQYARANLAKPKDSLGNADGEMTKTTNNMEDFKRPSSKLLKDTRTILQPIGSLGRVTSGGSNTENRSRARRETFSKTGRAILGQDGNASQGNTSLYQDTFTLPQVEYCPAEKLHQPEKSGYVFVRKDENHHFYLPVIST